MAFTQFLSRSPAKKVPSGAALKLKCPLVFTVRQPNRYHLDISSVNIIYNIYVTVLLETYSLFVVIESATIILSTSLTPLVILISRPLSRKDCP